MRDFSGWKYTSAENSVIGSPDGRSSTSILDPEVAEWLNDGNTPAAYVAPTPTYKELRAAEYPSVVDQLDKIYHTGIDGWKTDIKVVKDKYPKE